MKRLLFHLAAVLVLALIHTSAWAKKAAPCKPRQTLAIPGGGVRQVVVTPDGKAVITANKDGSLRVTDLKGKQLKMVKAHAAEVTALALSPDGKTLASGSEDKKVMLWDPRDLKQKAVLSGHNNTIRGLAFTPDGATLLSGSLDRQLGSWDVEGQKLKGMLGGQACVLNGVAASKSTYPNGGTMVGTACNDGLVRLWNLGTGKPVTAMDGHEGEVKAVAFSTVAGEGMHAMVTGDNDGKVLVWDVAAKKARLTLEAGWTDAVAFSPDGKLVVAAGNDMAQHGMFKLWDAQTGKLLNEQFPHDGNVGGVAFSADGKLLFTGSMDETVKVWEVDEVRKGCD
jgi:WD40 repeat protein